MKRTSPTSPKWTIAKGCEQPQSPRTLVQSGSAASLGRRGPCPNGCSISHASICTMHGIYKKVVQTVHELLLSLAAPDIRIREPRSNRGFGLRNSKT